MTGEKPHWVRCWVDGGVIGHNPSPRGVYWSARIERGNGDRPVIVRKRTTAYRTNNHAEYLALREVLLWLNEKEIKQPVVIYSDSKLIVNQFNERWACNVDQLVKLRAECKELAARLKWVAVTWKARDTMVRKLGH